MRAGRGGDRSILLVVACGLLGVSLLTLAGPADADTVDRDVDVGTPPVHDYLIGHIEGFFREGDEYLEPPLAGIEPRGPAGRALQEYRFNEGLRRTFFSFDRTQVVLVEIRDFRGASDSFLLNDVNWDPDAMLHHGERDTVIHYESPWENRIGRLERGMVSRFRVEVGVLVETEAFGSEELARQELDSLADRVGQEQFARVPHLEDVPIPLNDPGLRNLFRASSALVLPVIYLAMWLTNSVRSLRWRRRVDPAMSPIAGGANDAHTVDVSSAARSERRAARRVSAVAAAGFLIGVAVTWTMGTGDKLVLIGVWLVALVLARRLFLPTGQERGSYRSNMRSMGWKRVAVGSTLLLALVGAGSWLVDAAVVGYLFGLPPGEHAAMDPSGAMQFRFTQLQATLGFGAFALVPLVYRRLQAAARRRVRSVVELDGRPPVLYLRSFLDDETRVRAKRVARHSLFEYLRPGASDRFDEVVAWALWHRGPVVAIGEPGKPVTALGAAREYYTDDNWQGAVAAHAAAAPVIAITVGTSPGVIWELEHLRSSGHLARTIFVLPPADVADRRARLTLLQGTVLPDLTDEAADGLAHLPVLALRIGEPGRPVVYLGDETDASAYVAALEQASDGITDAATGTLDHHGVAATMEPPRPDRSGFVTWAVAGAAFLVLLPAWMVAAIPDEEESGPPGIPLTESANLPTCSGVQHLALLEDPLVVLSLCPQAEVIARTDQHGIVETVALDGAAHSVVPISDQQVVVGDLGSPVLYELSLDPFELVATHEVLPAPSSSLALVDGWLYATHPTTRTVSVLSLELGLERTLAVDTVPRAVLDGGAGDPLLIASHPPGVGVLHPEAGALRDLTSQVAAPRSATAIGNDIFVSDPGTRRILRLDGSGGATDLATLEVTDIQTVGRNLVAASYRSVSGYAPDGELLWSEPARYPVLVAFGDGGLAFTDVDPEREQPHRVRMFRSP